MTSFFKLYATSETDYLIFLTFFDLGRGSTKIERKLNFSTGIEECRSLKYV
jgi:hypothetical protein